MDCKPVSYDERRHLIYERRDLTYNQRHVLEELNFYCYDADECWPSLEDLESGIRGSKGIRKRKMLRIVISQLMEMGLISISSKVIRHQQFVVYRINWGTLKRQLVEFLCNTASP